jgi:hypothetical protein
MPKQSCSTVDLALDKLVLTCCYPSLSSPLHMSSLCTADGVCVSSDGCSVGTCTAAAAGTGCTFSQRGCNPVANGVNSCVTGDTCYPGGCKLTCIDGYAPSSDGTSCELYCGSATYTLTPPSTSRHYSAYAVFCNVCGSGYCVSLQCSHLSDHERMLLQSTIVLSIERQHVAHYS